MRSFDNRIHMIATARETFHFPPYHFFLCQSGHKYSGIRWRFAVCVFKYEGKKIVIYRRLKHMPEGVSNARINKYIYNLFPFLLFVAPLKTKKCHRINCHFEIFNLSIIQSLIREMWFMRGRLIALLSVIIFILSCLLSSIVIQFSFSSTHCCSLLKKKKKEENCWKFVRCYQTHFNWLCDNTVEILRLFRLFGTHTHVHVRVYTYRSTSFLKIF